MHLSPDLTSEPLFFLFKFFGTVAGKPSVLHLQNYLLNLPLVSICHPSAQLSPNNTAMLLHQLDKQLQLCTRITDTTYLL